MLKKYLETNIPGINIIDFQDSSSKEHSPPPKADLRVEGLHPLFSAEAMKEIVIGYLQEEGYSIETQDKWSLKLSKKGSLNVLPAITYDKYNKTCLITLLQSN